MELQEGDVLYADDIESRIEAMQMFFTEISAGDNNISFNRYGMAIVLENLIYCLKEIKKIQEEGD